MSHYLKRMSKKNKVVSTDSNKLAQALEAGKSIKGLIGYIKFEPDRNDEGGSNVYVKVKCLGMATKDCGISVIVEPISGDGQFNITPCRWIDTVKEVTDNREQDEALKKVVADVQQIQSGYYAHARRRALDAYAKEHLTKSQYEDFMEDIKEAGGIARLDANRVKTLAFTAASIRHGYKKPTKAANDYYDN